MKTKTERILNGESDKFTTKEILIEHIRSSQEFRKDVRTRLSNGSGKIARNWTSIKALCAGLGAMFTVLVYILFK